MNSVRKMGKYQNLDLLWEMDPVYGMNGIQKWNQLLKNFSDSPNECSLYYGLAIFIGYGSYHE